MFRRVRDEDRRSDAYYFTIKAFNVPVCKK